MAIAMAEVVAEVFLAEATSATISSDPRPDLEEDSALWGLLLGIASETNLQLAANLHGFRCIGTRLKRNRRWGLVMEPILPDTVNSGVPSESNGESNDESNDESSVTDWRDQNDYKEMAGEYLRPYHEELLQLFKRIG